MQKYLLKISYSGTSYCGWQVQPNGVSVQQVLGTALTKLFEKNIGVTGCSRTDSGVHAKEFCCHFEADGNIPANKIPIALNTLLPDTVRATFCKEVNADFHARYSCKGKNYIYKIYNNFYLDPFLINSVYFEKGELNTEKMSECAKLFIGKHDFSAFCASGSTVEDKVRTISECTVIKQDNIITISVSADGFLYNMVRIIAGTLIEVGRGARSPETVTEALLKKDRNLSGFTAPPQGLYLNKVFY